MKQISGPGCCFNQVTCGSLPSLPAAPALSEGNYPAVGRTGRDEVGFFFPPLFFPTPNKEKKKGEGKQKQPTTSKSPSQDALDAKARVGFSLSKAFLIR